MKRIRKIMFICCFVIVVIDYMGCKSINYVQCKNLDNLPDAVEYQYDSTGRIIYAVYPDGSIISYNYDAGGNVSNVEVNAIVNGKKDSDEKINTDSGTKDVNNIKDDDYGDSTMKNDDINPEKKENNNKSVEHSNNSKYLKDYKTFKSKRPVIKSLKKIKNKNRIYIKIQQVMKRGNYGEYGYQIRYAVNSKFKKSKTISVKRAKKGKYTTKKWKVKKNKIYYVKVRAYIKGVNGKRVYSKYSKVKKIKL